MNTSPRAGAHLVNLVPLGMEALLDRLALEELVADLQHAVRVRLALDQASEKFVLPFQVQGLQEVDPQDPLPEATPRVQRVRTESSRICQALQREFLQRRQYRFCFFQRMDTKAEQSIACALQLFQECFIVRVVLECTGTMQTNAPDGGTVANKLSGITWLQTFDSPAASPERGRGHSRDRMECTPLPWRRRPAPQPWLRVLFGLVQSRL